MTADLHAEIHRLAGQGMTLPAIAAALDLPGLRAPSAISKWIALPPTGNSRTEPYDRAWIARQQGRALAAPEASPREFFGPDWEGTPAKTPAPAPVPLTPPPDAAQAQGAPEMLGMPDPWDEAPPEASVPVEGNRILVISDLHIPHHDPQALALAMKAGKDFGADSVVLLGDIADFYAASAWERDPNRRDLAREVGALRQFFQVLRHTFKGAPIEYHLGNHEERFFRYLTEKAPELFNLDALRIESLFGLDALGGYRVTDRMQYLEVAGLALVHGHEFGRGGIAAPVNAARGLYLRAKTSAICGHFHQSSTHVERTLTGHVIATWALGCLCNLRPRYAPMNNWSQGFALIERDGDQYQVIPRKVIDGKVY